MAITISTLLQVPRPQRMAVAQVGCIKSHLLIGALNGAVFQEQVVMER